MPCVHITASKDPARKKFYMQCQIHASEWGGGGMALRSRVRDDGGGMREFGNERGEVCVHRS